MTENARIANTTINEYLREQEINIMQNQKCLALLQDKGRVSYDHEGQRLDWRVKKRRNSMSQYGEGQRIAFDRVNRWANPTLDWRGYVLGESIVKLEKLKNKGKAAIVKLVTDLTESMLDDVKYDFQRELFLDGNAAGRENSIHGFASCLSTAESGQWPAPNDSYGGLSCALGASGGSVISGAWPSGKMSPEYYYWSPLLVHWDHTSFTGSDEGTYMKSAIREAIVHSKNSKGKEGQLDMIVTTGAKYTTFLNTVDDAERIMVQRGQESQLVKLGFKDVFNFDGIDITYDIDVPSGEGFGLNINEIELCSLQKQLFVSGKDQEIQTQADLMTVDFFGNLKMNPRHIVHFSNY